LPGALGGVEFEGADVAASDGVGVPVEGAGDAALVNGEGASGVCGVDGRAAGGEGVGGSGAAVVGEGEEQGALTEDVGRYGA
jgi:hypothetical protein